MEQLKPFSPFNINRRGSHLFSLSGDGSQIEPLSPVQAPTTKAQLRTKHTGPSTPIRDNVKQRANQVNYGAVAVAATVESFYRSALNAILYRQLSGNSSIPLFPSMHVQVPTRIVYITGFKSLRAVFDQHFHPDSYQNKIQQNFANFAKAIAPGIIMTPVASVLEACNCGNVNPEPILFRSFRGVLPRGGREIIFGAGLNQLSDYFEDHYRAMFQLNPVVANSLGSVTAGVAAGYFSHVPHNVSVLRMLHPNKSYKVIFEELVQKSPAPAILTRNTPRPFANFVRHAWACLIPKGVFTRTVQICGSFVILNGIITLIERDSRHRKRTGNETSDNQNSNVITPDKKQR